MRIKVNMINFFFLAIFFSFFKLTSAEVFGASNVTQINSTRASADSPQSVEALAGNVTEITIFGSSITRTWQGYFGNVTGNLILADSSNNMMYNWSIISPRGQIYSSMNGTGIKWNNLQCFNFTSKGDYSDDKTNAGGTSQNGMNLTQLQNIFNIDSTGFDGH
jgi:hypothetical protein